MTSPYSRSKKALEADGFKVGRCEHWNSFSHIRQDLYGIIDFLAVRDSIIAVQVTTGDQMHNHLVKALGNEVVPLWLKSGGRFQLHGWRKVNNRGKSREHWECRIMELVWDGKGMQVKTL